MSRSTTSMWLSGATVMPEGPWNRPFADHQQMANSRVPQASSASKALDLLPVFVKDCHAVMSTLCDYQLIITTESNKARPIQSRDSLSRSTSHGGRRAHTNSERTPWDFNPSRFHPLLMRTTIGHGRRKLFWFGGA